MNLFSFNFVNPLKTYHKARRYFKRPKCHIYIGKTKRGFPICIDMVGKILNIWCNDIIWKDKFREPRFEYNPSINIEFFRKWQIYIEWGAPVANYKEFWCLNDCYWEAMLYYLYYNKSPKESCKLVSGWENSKGNILTKEDIEYCILK